MATLSMPYYIIGRPGTGLDGLLYCPRMSDRVVARPSGNAASRIYTVSNLTRQLQGILEGRFPDVVVEGEVTGCKPSSSGHYYFNLVDYHASLSVAVFKNRHHLLLFSPRDGERVRVRGGISVYQKRGSYQLIAEGLERAGEGELLALLDERKRRLAAEGLFDAERKRALPLRPRRIAVVTSPTGAAVRDIFRVLKRRNAGIDLVILPTPVQGAEAASRIAKQIQIADRWRLAEVIVVTRGGGSLEDLLPFSDERVVRAISASRTPVISAVGHAVDGALSDLVADHQAPTPSAAAETVAAAGEELLQRVHSVHRQLNQALGERLGRARLLLDQFLPDRLQQSARRVLDPARLRLDDAVELLARRIGDRIVQMRHALTLTHQTLLAASPLSILERGYAVVSDGATGKALTTATDVTAGVAVNIRLHRGRLAAEVTDVHSEAEPSGDV